MDVEKMNDNELIKTLYELLHSNKHLSDDDFEAQLDLLNDEAEKRELL